MSARFEQLDHQETPMGVISLRRRFHPVIGVDVWEAMLGDEHLMSSLFTASEDALGRLPLVGVEPRGDGLDVVVGGLGLGYTAAAVLDDDRVSSLRVVDALPAVVDWHRRGLLPLSATLTDDPRCRLVVGDFFDLVARNVPFGPDETLTHDAILVDIDHTPDHHLHPSHAAFYEPAGLARLAQRLHPGGVFALWSDARPDPSVVELLGGVFARARAEEISFPNPLTGGEAANTVYVATTSTS